MNLTALYQIRAVISKYAKKYELILKVVLKFTAFLVLFQTISGAEMYAGEGVFNSFSAHLIFALVATLLPSRTGVLLAIALTIYNIFQSSVIGAAIVGLMMLVLYVAVVRMFPDQVYFLMLIPICIQWQLYLLAPIFAGLYVGVIAVVPVVAGILMWGLIQIIPAFMSLQMGESLDLLPKMISDASTYGLDQMTKNNQMMYLMMISVGIILLVSLLKKLRLDHMRYIALGAGGILGIVCLIMGSVAGEFSGNLIVIVLLGIAVILGIAALEFFRLALNYQSVQNLDFEDEEYYYQVRLIPKINPVGKSKKEVKNITETEEELGKTKAYGWKPEETSEKQERRSPAHRAARPVHAAPKNGDEASVKPLRTRPRQTAGQHSASHEPQRAERPAGAQPQRPQRPANPQPKKAKEEEIADLFEGLEDSRRS